MYVIFIVVLVRNIFKSLKGFFIYYIWFLDIIILLNVFVIILF